VSKREERAAARKERAAARGADFGRRHPFLILGVLAVIGLVCVVWAFDILAFLVFSFLAGLRSLF
jgi:cobalamin biosynthesis Mg chelatase CobN